VSWLWTLFICWVSVNLILLTLLFLIAPNLVEVGEEEWREFQDFVARWEGRRDLNHRRRPDGRAPLRPPDAPSRAAQQPLRRASVPVPLGRGDLQV
jgi:hypothetical protein